MTEPTQDQKAITTAQGLIEVVQGLTGEVSNLRKYGRHNRRFIIVDVILSILLAAVSLVAFQASQRAGDASLVAASEHTNLIASCRLTNESRAASVMLWEHLAQVAKPAPGSTPKQIAADKQQVAKLIAYVRTVYRPRDCTTLYHLPRT